MNAATLVVRSHGQEPRFSEEASVLVDAKEFYVEWEKELEAEKAKDLERAADVASVVDDDEEMSDATVGAPVVKGKGKGKVAARMGYADWRWPDVSLVPRLATFATDDRFVGGRRRSQGAHLLQAEMHLLPECKRRSSVRGRQGGDLLRL